MMVRSMVVGYLIGRELLVGIRVPMVFFLRRFALFNMALGY